MEEMMTKEEFIVLKLTHLKALMMKSSKGRMTPWLKLVEDSLTQAIQLDINKQNDVLISRGNCQSVWGQHQLSMISPHSHDEFKDFRTQRKSPKRQKRTKQPN